MTVHSSCVSRYTFRASYTLHNSCMLHVTEFVYVTCYTISARYTLHSSCMLHVTQYVHVIRYTVRVCYPLHSFCMLHHTHHILLLWGHYFLDTGLWSGGHKQMRQGLHLQFEDKHTQISIRFNRKNQGGWWVSSRRPILNMKSSW